MVNKKTILLTGAAGFIGFHLIRELIARGDEVIGVDNINDYYDPKLKKERLKILKQLAGFKFYKADISNYKKLQKIFKKHDKITHVCNIAAQAGVRYSIENPFTYEESNCKGFLNVLECCRHNKIKNLVYCSSSSIYGDENKAPFKEDSNTDKPESLYAATKKFNELAAHAYHKLYGLNCTGLRFFTVYGPWGRPDMAYYKFSKKIMNDEEIEVYGHGKHRRDFTYVSDIVAGFIAALDKSYPLEVFNLGCSNPVELMDFIKILEDALGKKAKKKMLPKQPGDVYETYADTSKAKKMLGYKPKISFKEGIKEFVEWFKEHDHL